MLIQYTIKTKLAANLHGILYRGNLLFKITADMAPDWHYNLMQIWRQFIIKVTPKITALS